MNTPKPLPSLSLIQQAFPDQAKLVELTRLVVDRDSVSHVEIEDALRAVNRRFDKLPLKSRALDLYTNNRIVLLGNKETVKAPTILPAWRVASERGVVAYVNATPYVPASGAAQMDVRRLFGLLVFGAVMVDAYDNWTKVVSSTGLAQKASAVYSRMMHKVADRLTGAGMDKMRSDQLKYAFAKFCLIGMMGRAPSETTDAAALAATSGVSSRAALTEFEGTLAQAAQAADQAALYGLPLTQFLAAIPGAAPWANRMTVRGFVQAFTAMYGNPSLLLMEDLSFFLAGLATHQVGAEIISSYSFDPVFGRDGEAAIDELARLLR